MMVFQRPLRWLLWASLAVYAGFFSFVVWQRVWYPCFNDGREMLMVLGAWQLAQGQPLYSNPSGDPFYVSTAYQFGYPLVLAGVFKVTGLELWVGRVVSLVANLLTFGLLGWICARQGRGWKDGLLGVLVYLSFFPPTAQSYAQAHPHGLFPLFGLFGLYCLERWGRNRWGIVLGAGACVASVFTHQIGMGFALGAASWLFGRDRRAALLFGGMFVGLSGVLAGVAQWVTEGWYKIWVLDMPIIAPVEWRKVHLLVNFGIHSLGVWLGVGALLLVRGRDVLRGNVYLHGLVWIAPFAVLPVLKAFGVTNTLAPVALLASILFVQGITEFATAKVQVRWERLRSWVPGILMGVALAVGLAIWGGGIALSLSAHGITTPENRGLVAVSRILFLLFGVGAVTALAWIWRAGYVQISGHSAQVVVTTVFVAQLVFLPLSPAFAFVVNAPSRADYKACRAFAARVKAPDFRNTWFADFPGIEAMATTEFRVPLFALRNWGTVFDERYAPSDDLVSKLKRAKFDRIIVEKENLRDVPQILVPIERNYRVEEAVGRWLILQRKTDKE